MKIGLLPTLLGGAAFCFASLAVQAAEPPHIRMENETGQLIVNGQPFLILGGELGNSSAGTSAEADLIVPNVALMHGNTILMPVTWEQLEPKEGGFDFTILDQWIETARRHNMHLVLLWPGSWKNAFSNYAPSWVKSDPKRSPRAESADGARLEIISTLSAEKRRSDSRALAALMHHLLVSDSQQQTVLMAQVENEVGYPGPGRDRSREANRLFRGPVPDSLICTLAAKRLQLPPELAGHFNEHGRTWSEVFGDSANEVFMAWNYTGYIETVAHPGKGEYAVRCGSYVCQRSASCSGGKARRVPQAEDRIHTISMSGARPHPASISIRRTSIGRILKIGWGGTTLQIIRPSYRSTNGKCPLQCPLRLRPGARLRFQLFRD